MSWMLCHAEQLYSFETCTLADPACFLSVAGIRSLAAGNWHNCNDAWCKCLHEVSGLRQACPASSDGLAHSRATQEAAELTAWFQK